MQRCRQLRRAFAAAAASIACAAMLCCAVAASADDKPTATDTAASDPVQPTLITVHEHGASFDDVAAKVCKQANIPFAIVGDPPTAASTEPFLNIDADAQPFWEVLANICDQHGFSFAPQFNGRETIISFMRTPTNPHFRSISGPVMAQITQVQHLQQLTAPPGQVDFCDVTAQIFWEPRLKVQCWETSGPPLQAVDENGASLVPDGEAATLDPRQENDRRSIVSSLQSRRQNQFGGGSQTSYSIRLKVPAHPGKRISLLRGQVRLWIDDRLDSIEIDAKQVANNERSVLRLGDAEFTCGFRNLNDTQVQGQLQFTRGNADEDTWKRRQVALQSLDAHVVDADGHEWGTLQQGPGYGMNNDRFMLLLFITRNAGVTTSPAKFTLKASLHPIELDVPYLLHDLPLP